MTPPRPHDTCGRERRARSQRRGRIKQGLAIVVLASVTGVSVAGVKSAATTTTVIVRVSDLVERGRVADAAVIVQRVGRGRTQENGTVRLRASGLEPGVYALRIRARGFWPRKTWVPFNSSSRVRVREMLLPRDERFDMAFFDLAARAVGGATSRWQTRPRVRLIGRRLECVQGGAGPGCPTWRTTGEPVSASLQAMLQEVSSELVIGLTGPLRGDASLVLWTPLPGDLITREELLADGFITVAEHGVVTAHRIFPEYAGGDVIHTQVWLVPAPVGTTPFLVSQTLAITLGYAGRPSFATCDDLARRGLRTLLCESHGVVVPTEADRIAGRALYSRPPGNRWPDRDPKPDP